MEYYDIYGSDFSLQKTRNIIESAFEFKFSERESSYFGVYYLSKGIGKESFEIKCNLDLSDGLPLEADFLNVPTLVYINCTIRHKELLAKMVGLGFNLLRHDKYEGD